MNLKFITTNATSEIFGDKNKINPSIWVSEPFVFKNTEIANILTLEDCLIDYEQKNDSYCIVEFTDDKGINYGFNYFKVVKKT